MTTQHPASSPLTVQTWADETWPLNSREASEIVAEQALQGATPVQKAPASSPTLDAEVCRDSTFEKKMLPKEDDDSCVMTEQFSSSQGDTNACLYTESTLISASEKTSSPASFGDNKSFSTFVQHDSARPSSQGSEKKKHVKRAFIHDPYCALTGIRLISVCSCSSCRSSFGPSHSSSSTQEEPSSSFSSYASAAPTVTPAYAMMSAKSTPAPSAVGLTTTTLYQQSEPLQQNSPTSPCGGMTLASALQEIKKNTTTGSATNGFCCGDQKDDEAGGELPNVFTPYPAAPYYGEAPRSQLGATRSLMMIPAPPAGTCHGGGSKTSFMPPAPPNVKKFTSAIFNNEDDRTEEKETVVAAAMFTIMARWYNRVVDSQSSFLPEVEHCPVVENYQTVDRWSAACQKWWMNHFAEKQKKYKPLPASKQVSLKNSAAAAAASASSTTDALGFQTATEKLAAKKAKKNKKKALKRAARKEALRQEKTFEAESTSDCATDEE